MSCPEERLVAFLAGELSAEEERRFDEHLLGCEQCWRAVQADRTARLALEQLRQPAPAGLQGRVAASVALAATEAPKGPVVVRAAPLQDGHPVTVAVAQGRYPSSRAPSRRRLLGCGGGRRQLRLGRRPRRAAPEPAQVAAVVAMLTPRLGADHGSSGRRALRHRRPAPGRAAPTSWRAPRRSWPPRPGRSPYLQRRTGSAAPHPKRGWPPRAACPCTGSTGAAAVSPCSSWRPCPWRKCLKWRPVSGSSELHLGAPPGRHQGIQSRHAINAWGRASLTTNRNSKPPNPNKGA